MTDIGKPTREIYVEPMKIPVPQRAPAPPPQTQTPKPVPKRVPA
jgi:hypothetical protein